MPRERTLDERVRALERSVDAAGVTSETPPEVGTGESPPKRGAASTTTGPSRSPSTDGAAGKRQRNGEDGDTGPGVNRDDSTDSGGLGVNGGGSTDGEIRGVNRDGSPDSEGRVRPRNGDHHGDVESRLAAVEAELAELEAGLQAVRGYVGNIDHVNESVERRANAALAAVDRFESVTGSAPSIARATTSPEPRDDRDGDGNDTDEETATPGAEAELDQLGSTDRSTGGPGLLKRLASLV